LQSDLAIRKFSTQNISVRNKSKQKNNREENKRMDYVTNNATIAREKKSDNAAIILAYDMAIAKLKKKRKEKKKHA
jgi:hypothetical protein